MNKVILIGNLTRDVELTTTSNGTSIAKFSLAVNRNFKNSEGERDADFINIIAWRELGERCAEYLAKGKKAGVVGSIQSRSYETQDGDKRYVTEVVASEVEFLTPRGNDRDEPAAPPQGKKTYKELEPVEDDDLPF